MSQYGIFVQLDMQPECIKQWVPNGLGSDSNDHSSFIFMCDEGDESGIDPDSLADRDVLLDLLQRHVAVDEIVCDTSILWHCQHRDHVGLVQAVLVVLPAESSPEEDDRDESETGRPEQSDGDATHDSECGPRLEDGKICSVGLILFILTIFCAIAFVILHDWYRSDRG